MHSLFPGFARVLLMAIGLGVVAGCGPGRVPIPTYDPDGMARAAMVEYDKNGDGKLDGSELEACPALKDALRNIGAEDRGFLKEAEIADRMRNFKESNIGLRAVRCTVSRGRQVVPGVTVSFVPEKFMGGAIKPGSAVTDANGVAVPRVEGQDVDGVSLGYYRIEISLKDASGKETLPEQFNTKTKYGQEVHHRRQVNVEIDVE